MNPVASRLLNQQLTAPQFCNPVEVVSWLGAIQAQEYRLMRWAVEMRTKKPSAAAFKDAYDKGLIIRQHLMRGTWQLVTGEDFHWMMDLFRNKATSTIKGWMHSNHIEISEEEELRIRPILERTAAEKRSCTKEDFELALSAEGISMDDHRLSYHIRFAELKGYLCSGDLLPMKASYSLTAQKIPGKEVISRDEALYKITQKYFQSRQPATLEDFIWWTGLNVSDCKKGLEMHKGWLHKETYKGREFYISDDSRNTGFKKGQYLLIPPYDEYLIGYKTRDIVLPEEFRHRAHNNSGNFNPVITYDGVICGNWKAFSDNLEESFFEDDKGRSLPDEVIDNYFSFRK